MHHQLKIAIAQIAPVWLNKAQTIQKIEDYTAQAGSQGCELLVFGEGLLPGYPFWLSLTKTSEFNNQAQKEIHAHYSRPDVTKLLISRERQSILGFMGEKD